MQRLIEQPVGDGDVLHRSASLGRARYHLAVYQHFADPEQDESVPVHTEVEGRVITLDNLKIADLQRKTAELTLRLADGRLLDFLIVHADGTIHSTGRGLYKPDR
jgi:hypothetical protein